MATTTNYSWSTPDDTALVKDGAAAIRTLGSSADTTVKALNPGTTAGDIDYYTTSTAKARVGIGTAGQVLTVNSGATAPEWAAVAAGGMTLISTTALTGASVTLSSIPATYNNLQLIIRNIAPGTDNTDLVLRLNGDTNGNRYTIRGWSQANSANEPFGSDAFYNTLNSIDNAVSRNLNVINFYDYTNTTTFKYGTSNAIGTPYNDTTGGAFNHFSQHLFYNQLPAISSITIFFLSGNISAGTALLYGVK
jgi:hypothetical protein